MLVGKFKIMISGPKTDCNSSLFVWVEGGGKYRVDCIWYY